MSKGHPLMRARLTLAAAAGVLALAAPAFAVTPTADCHGVAVTDSTNDQALVSSSLPVRPTKAIDIVEAFVTGSAGSQKVNVRVASLDNTDTAVGTTQNVEYQVTWDDAPLSQYGYRFTASFLTTNGVYSAGDYLLERTQNGSWISIIPGVTGRTFNVVGGVIQFDLPSGVTFPSSTTNVAVRAVQYENANATVVAIRADNASALTYSSPC
jgi:hypothetical protein